jgi:vacuolar-type H+-ATPase subunit I/STV1
MEEKIKNALKQAGLDEGLYERIKDKIKSEEDIWREIIAFQIQSETDRRVTQAIQTQTEKIKTLESEKTELATKLEAAGKAQNVDQSNPGGQSQGAGDNTPDIAKIVQDAVKAATEPLQSKIDAIEGKDAEKSRAVIIAEHLKKAGLNETLVPFIGGKTEDEIKQQVETLKANTIAKQQEEFDKVLAESGVPRRGTVGDKANPDTVNAIVSKHPFAKKKDKE